jgi:hypothetical protein
MSRHEKSSNSAFALSRRQFVGAGLALTAGSLLPHTSALAADAGRAGTIGGAEVTQSGRRLLGGKLEVSALGLGCMVMSGLYGARKDNRPETRREMIRLIRSAADRA